MLKAVLTTSCSSDTGWVGWEVRVSGSNQVVLSVDAPVTKPRRGNQNESLHHQYLHQLVSFSRCHPSFCCIMEMRCGLDD